MAECKDCVHFCVCSPWTAPNESYPEVGGCPAFRDGKDNDVPTKWISVKDRLPEGNGAYIVTACDENCAAGEGIWYDTVVVVAEYYKGDWTWNENGTEYDLCGIVTHWMPLPQPPKRE